MLFLFIISIILALTNALQTILHYREKRQLFDRYMAGDLKEYKYLEKEYPSEVKQKRKLFEEREKKSKEMRKGLKNMDNIEREKIAKSQDY
ncbi:MAG TPA: hypothetical protein VFG01_01030 [Acidobacteriota bacterium]|nr:hypothetical protein [Acidobacteriota bacterium]